METKNATQQLSALAHDRRLDAFRLLVQAGTDGLPAGQLAEKLGVPANTLSAQLTILSNADLIGGERDGRSIIYRANFAAITGLILFLMEDCCGGAKDVCTPIFKSAQAGC